MDKLVVFNNTDLSRLLNISPYESKFGEYVNILPSTCNIYEYLQKIDVDYVILGLPEAVGISENDSSRTTTNVWQTTLKNILNIQQNEFTAPERVLILGHLDFEKELTKLNCLNPNIKKELAKSRKIVAKIDKHLTHLMHTIINAGKKPILIGGGLNNAYGNIKGGALAFKSPINVISFDTHIDFKPEEGRHSKNGFTYAFTEGFLSNYFIFGLHENHLSARILNTLNKLNHVNYSTYEDIEVKQKSSFKKELQKGLSFIENKPFGIEINCGAIENSSSNVFSPSGFSLKKSRQFVYYFGKQTQAKYLHISNDALTESNTEQIGKLITYLITDFIQASSTKTTDN